MQALDSPAERSLLAKAGNSELYAWLLLTRPYLKAEFKTAPDNYKRTKEPVSDSDIEEAATVLFERWCRNMVG